MTKRPPSARSCLTRAALMVLLLVPFASTVHAQKAAKGKQDKSPAQKISKPSWIKICPKQEKDFKVCIVQVDGLNSITGQPYSPVSVEIVLKGKEQKTQLIASFQHIMPAIVSVTDKKTKKKRNVLRASAPRIRIQAGVRYQIDKQKYVDMKFLWCDQVGCLAGGEAKDDLVKSLKNGKIIVVAIMNNERLMPVPVPLKGFKEAFDGPPLEIKAFQKRIQARIQQFRIAAASAQKRAKANAAAAAAAAAKAGTTVKKK
ncbi:hypothetical protein MnTg02_00225 [bacterium MnTg02]|nr:hypothetical protein MnTg02_00225 [bacterium MnTg02]